MHGGRALHRWGYVSLAFYAASFAAIALAVAAALLLGRAGAWARALFELRGLASLALVPWHYAVIVGTAAVLDVASLARWGWLVGTIAMVVAAFALSRRTETMAVPLAARARTDRRIAVGLGIAVALAFVVKLALAATVPLLAFAAVVAGQVLLCVAFAMPTRAAAEPRRKAVDRGGAV